MKKDSDDHGGKMLPCQSSGVRRQAHGTRGSRVEGPEVKHLGQRGVDRDLIVIVLRKKPARGSTRERENEITK